MIPLLFLLFLLFPSHHSFAEDSWVLWESSSKSAKTKWMIFDAYPEWSHCIAALKKVAKSTSSKLSGEVNRREVLNHIEIHVKQKSKKKAGPSTKLMYSYFCLPGTLDPRE